MEAETVKSVSRGPRRWFTQEEDDYILHERKRGTLFASIAHRLGRDRHSVAKRFRWTSRLRGSHSPPSKGRVFSSSEDEVIIRMMNHGRSVSDIAAKLSATSKKTIEQVHARLHRLREAGLVKLARQREFHPPLTKSDIDRICADREAGLTWREIGVKEGRNGVALSNDRALRSHLSRQSAGSASAPWSAAEIQQMKHLRDEQGLKWKQIASILGRTVRELWYRYGKHCSKAQITKPHSHKSGLRRAWSAEDDATLLSLVKKYGIRWRTIQAFMSDRSTSSLKWRYARYLVRKIESSNDSAEHSGSPPRDVKRED
ncbi:uncharacterized protein RHO25_002239 [Cercospora beticola]|uniref:Uncharacterized protein n=1 Tax=Cercospora beticola TaxID=122368 RepID=A0ABZ0NDP6_CERBT|nr:hypothetical protein RHO25_002239 [Cercospora beticola]